MSLPRALVLVPLAGCPSPVETGPPDRAPGDRTPLTASCDETDALRCLLPWPSNVSIDPQGLDTRDDVTVANLADGFSRSTALLTGFNSKWIHGACMERHGFAARHFIATVAARDQIRRYLQSVWAGSPSIVLPQACVDNGGSCDVGSQ